jgi:hypothetical protein
MKRGLLAALVGVALGLSGLRAAGADEGAGYDKAGGFGLGASVTNRGEPGVNVFFVPAPRIGVQGVVHFDSTSADGSSDSNLGITINGMYSLLSDGGFQLPALLGLDFSRAAHSADGQPDENSSGVSILLGVQPAWWPAPELSFHLTLALAIDLASDGGRAGVGDGTRVALPGTPEFLGSVAVTYWIK